MVKTIRAQELLTPVPVPTPSECPNAGERGVTRTLKAVQVLSTRYGFRPGGSAKEKDSDYSRALKVDIGSKERLIVCKDEIQVIHQRYIGSEWRSQSFHTTLNRLLEGILGDVRSEPKSGRQVPPHTKCPNAAQRGATESLRGNNASRLGVWHGRIKRVQQADEDKQDQGGVRQ